jgi:DNA-binding transcriptional LysR family regulator
MSRRTHPETGYRACLGVIRLADRYGRERVDAACAHAVSIGSPSFKTVQSILKSGLDRAPLFEPPPRATIDHDMVARRIGPVPGKVVASPGYVAQHGAPATPEELLGHQALMQGTESWRFIDGDKTVSVRPQGRFKADNGTALLLAAVAGLGIAYLPDFLTAEPIASGALVHVMTRYPVPDGGVYLVRPQGPQPSQKLRVLTELLIERCG